MEPCPGSDAQAPSMNLLREVEIHCISIRDAQPGWLQRLAELGLGTLTKR